MCLVAALLLRQIRGKPFWRQLPAGGRLRLLTKTLGVWTRRRTSPPAAVHTEGDPEADNRSTGAVMDKSKKIDRRSFLNQATSIVAGASALGSTRLSPSPLLGANHRIPL